MVRSNILLTDYGKQVNQGKNGIIFWLVNLFYKIDFMNTLYNCFTWAVLQLVFVYSTSADRHTLLNPLSPSFMANEYPGFKNNQKQSPLNCILYPVFLTYTKGRSTIGHEHPISDVRD